VFYEAYCRYRASAQIFHHILRCYMPQSFVCACMCMCMSREHIRIMGRRVRVKFDRIVHFQACISRYSRHDPRLFLLFASSRLCISRRAQVPARGMTHLHDRLSQREKVVKETQSRPMPRFSPHYLRVSDEEKHRVGP